MPAHKLQGRLTVHGLSISVENAKGSTRKWYDPHGKEKGRTLMRAHYGYIRNTRGTDGDHVDVYVGPNPESERVFIIDQMKKPAVPTKGPWKEFDEQKVMLGFESAEAAKALYMKQYDDPRFFGGLKEMDMDEFKTKVLEKANHGKKVAELLEDPRVIQAIRRQIKQAALLSELKMASADRAGRIADRIDDVGIGVLAAPYVADAVGHRLEKSKNLRVSGFGKALHAGLGTKSRFGESHGREIAGLAMVAPGVTHAMAKGVDKVMPKKAALEKIAQQMFDDYEYKTEPEKTAILGALGRMAGGVARGGRAVGTGASGLAGKASDALRGGFIAGSRGVSQQVGERAARLARTTAAKPVAAAAAPVAKAPVQAAKRDWNPLSAKNVVLGTAAAGVGLGAYGGFKGIQTASNLVQTHGEPLQLPGFAGPGRAF